MAGYDLPPITDIRTLDLGNNAVFEVVTAPAVHRDGSGRSSGERFALRIHRPGYRSVAHTRSELLFLQEAQEHLEGSGGVDVARPVPDRDGRLVVEVDLPADETSDGGRRHCDLSTWVDGEVLVPGAGLTSEAVHRLGRAAALLHDVADRFEPPVDFDLPRWDTDGMFTTQASPFRPLLGLDEILSPTDRSLFDEIAERTRAVFEALESESDSVFGVIHGDYILGNCHLRRADNQWDVGVIDFDDSGWGYFLYDICPLLGNLAGYPGAIAANPDFPSLRTSCLDGYRTVRQLPVAWEAYLPVLMAARNANQCLWTAGLDMSPTPRQDAAWRMELARRCLELPT